MEAESNQPVGVQGVTQEEKNNASIIQGLVLGGGLLGLVPGLNFIGWLCGVAVIVLYFVWKDKGPFVGHHAKQGLGLQLILIGIGILLVIIGGIIAAASFGALMSGSVGGLGGFGVLSFLGIVALVLNLGAAALGLFGLLAAQKGERYTYPVIGEFIANYGKK